MIRREALQAAVSRIAELDPAAGHELAGHLASGLLRPGPAPAAPGEDPVLEFLGEPVPVHRHQLIHQGAEAVLERLALRYGELLRQRQQPLAAEVWQRDRQRREARRAGLNYLLDLRLDEEIARYQAELERRPYDEHLSANLTLLEDLRGDFPGDALPWNPAHGTVFFKGVVEVDTSALFVQLPINRDSLLQIADRDLEFFNLRLVLDVLRRGQHRNLFACVVHGRLAGMILVGATDGAGPLDLEIRYLATAHGGPHGHPARGEWVHRGAGAMLLAGAWLLWRIYEPNLAGLVAHAEPAAVNFYESLGFAHAQPHVYRLEDPRGHFLRNIVAMANRRAGLPDNVLHEISFMVRRQARALIAAEVSDPFPRADHEARRTAGAFFFEECFRAKRSLPWAGEAVAALVERGQGLPWCEELLQCAHEYGLVHHRGEPEIKPPLLLVIDDRFAGHLEKILSFESGKRLRALLEVIDDPELDHRWRKIPVRQATVDELRLVHTPQHIQRCAGTFGPRTAPAGEEIIASERVQDTALFAVGGLLNLLDEILAGRGERGFALVRPPGHHAEPDKAMGFCFFNNVALGAQYLLERHGLERVMIVDIDAHHGNGTQRIFWEDPRVLFVSIHRGQAYPWTGEADEVGEGPGRGSTVNVPIDRRVDDRDYALILQHLVRPLAHRFQPRFLLVSCGFDLHREDPIGELSLTEEGYRWIADLLLRTAREVCDGHVAWVLEGGYSVSGIKKAGAKVLRRLAGLDALSDRDLASLRADDLVKVPGIKKVLEVQRELWDLT